MDKITRILILYSRLINGETINKPTYCLETGSNERSFDRDIEDIRLFLAESYSADELVYDRSRKCYFLSRTTKQEIDSTIFSFLKRVLIKTAILRKDELEGMLEVLASNTNKKNEYKIAIDKELQNYQTKTNSPLLKMHDDISSVIISKTLIEIKYHELSGEMQEYRIIPYDIVLIDDKIYVVSVINDEKKVRLYLLENIESFIRITNISAQEYQKIENIVKKEGFSDGQKDKVCT